MRKFRGWTGPLLARRLPFGLLVLSSGTLIMLIALGLIIQTDLTVSVDGKTRPDEWHEIRAGRDGVLAKVHVREGDWVDSGALLAEFFNEVEREAVIMAERRLASLLAEKDQVAADVSLTAARQRTDVAEARAGIDEIEAGAHPDEIRRLEESVEQAKIHLREAEKDARNGEILARSEAIPANELRRRQTELENARLSLSMSEATLAQTRTRFREHDFARSAAVLAGAEAWRHGVTLKRAGLRSAGEDANHAAAALEIARTNLELTALRAPAAGRVLTGDVEELIGKGYFPGQVVMAIGDPETIVIKARLPEGKAADLSENLRANVFIAAFPHTRYKTFDGVVEKISPYFQTIDWEALGIPEEEVTPEMREAFTTATIVLDDPFVDDKGETRMISPGLSARCDVLLDQGSVLAVLIRYLRRGYQNIPNINFHF